MEKPVKNKDKLIFKTKRLIIRQLKNTDFWDTVENRTDPDIFQYISKPMSIKEVYDFVKEYSKPWQGEKNERLALGIILKTENKLIGELMVKHLDNLNKVSEIGFIMNKNYQRKNYTYEAIQALIQRLFEKFNTKKLVAFCDVRNEASFKLMEKVGMSRSKETIKKNDSGEIIHQYHYFLTKEKWIKINTNS